jgi:Ni/Co efflux regulator RcnB
LAQRRPLQRQPRGVQDWGRYHLEAPPPGYEWVQDGNELVLISISTGVIATVLANIIQ